MTDDIAILVQKNVERLSPERVIKITPVYLVKYEDPTEKTVFRFIATRLLEQNTHIKLVGVFVDIKKEKEKKSIAKNVQEWLKSISKENYKEVLIPWNRIIYIENLIFKQK